MSRRDDDRVAEVASWRFWNISGRQGAWREELLCFAVAPIAIAIAWAACIALTPVLHGAPQYLLFLAAVLVTAGFGGLGPGLLATVLGAVLGLVGAASSPAITPPEIVYSVRFP